jgi:serine/threonine-protein kinase PpkA
MRLNLKTLALTTFSVFFCCSTLAETPLLQEGKKTVFQRVVSNPNAVLYSDDKGTQVINKPRTFTSFYVYKRQGNMVRVGVSTTEALGWMKADSVTEWPQAITMLFTDQMGRQPVLFFKDHETVTSVCTADSIKNTVEQYVTLFNDKDYTVPEDSPVIATEPLAKDGQVSNKNFYLLPVMNIDTQFNESGTQLLEVACLNPGIQKDDTEDKKGNKQNSTGSNGMTTGIAFVVDTTISMKPYIDGTKDIIRKIFDKLQDSKAKDNIAIAVIGYRSNVQLRPKIEYNTKVVSDFTSVRDRAMLESYLDGLEEATASTHDFDEDAMAGVKDAVDKLSWDKVDSKIILLVTDAGPLDGSDKTSRTGMSSEGMAEYLRTNNIYLTAVHIQTPKAKKLKNGKNDVAYAKKNYMELSRMSNNQSSYIAINALDPNTGAEAFKKVGNAVADVFCKIAESQVKGKSAEKPHETTIDKNASTEDQARHLAEITGYAMQLQFAGNQNETTAPHVVKAWIADSDLVSLEEHPNDTPVPAVIPAVLLTKTQLSQLRKQVNTIITTAEEAFLQDSSDFNFYEQLISAAAQMSRDPSAFTDDPNANLAQKGVLLEVLDGLPYKSRILGLKQEDWVNMSTGEQQEFIKRLKGLVRLYDEYDKDNTHWESFGSKNVNDYVYRIPLNVLP